VPTSIATRPASTSMLRCDSSAQTLPLRAGEGRGEGGGGGVMRDRGRGRSAWPQVLQGLEATIDVSYAAST
jgi:hypothetical protein